MRILKIALIVLSLLLVSTSHECLAQDALAEAYVVQGRRAYQRGDYDEAVRLFEKARTSFEAISTNLETLDIAALYNDLGQAYRRTGSFQMAEACLQSSIKLKEKLLGTNSIRVAQSLENLAEVYIDDSENPKYAEAEALLRKAITIRNWKQGKGTVDTANDYLKLGEIYENKLYDYDAAIKSINTAKSLWSRSFGARDPRIGKCHHYIARSCMKKNSLKEALANYDKAYSIYSKHLPSTKSNIEQLKTELREAIDLEKTEAFNKLTERRNELGQDNKNVALLPDFTRARQAAFRSGDLEEGKHLLAIEKALKAKKFGKSSKKAVGRKRKK